MKRSKQIATAFLIIFSLFVSSVAACVCSHHTEKVETEVSSCHEQSETKHETANSDENIFQLSAGDECSCSAPAPRAFSKSETIKIEKQAAILPVSTVEIKVVSTIVFVETVVFEKPFYLSDSFYNLKSPRAPPVA